MDLASYFSFRFLIRESRPACVINAGAHTGFEKAKIGSAD